MSETKAEYQAGVKAVEWNNDTVPLSAITPWEHNPKSISKAHAKRLLAYWDKIGQFQTLAVGPDGELYDGHQRYAVLLAAHGDQFQVDVRRASRALSEDERRELVVQAHAGTVGQWSWDAIANWDAGKVQEWGMDGELLKDWKADASALTAMIEANKPHADAEPQIDRAAELLEKWQVKTGDLWRIGEHRLLCGDSTKREDVERVMGGEKAQMIFTDPPYNIDYEYAEYDDDKTTIEYLAFVDSFIAELVNVSGNDCPFYIMSANNKQDDIKRIMIDSGIHFHQWLYWIKPHPGYLGRSDYIQNYETINYGYLGKHRFNGNMQLAAEVVDRAMGSDKVDHPAQRPTSLVEKFWRYARMMPFDAIQ